MGRPRRDRDAENAEARAVYEQDRQTRSLFAVRPSGRHPVKTRREQEAEWAARSGPVTTRRLHGV